MFHSVHVTFVYLCYELCYRTSGEKVSKLKVFTTVHFMD